MGCVTLALAATLPARGATQIHFDELTAREALYSQYLAQGVVFGPDEERWTVVASGSPEWPAPSPPNVAAVLYDSDAEVQFLDPVAGVSARFVTGGTTLQVTAYSEGGVVLDVRTVSSPPGGSVLYLFAANNSRVARLRIEGTPSLWGLDDLTLDPGAPPVTAAHVDGTAGANGWYRSAVTMHLAAGDPNGDAVVAVHYSIDGGADVTTAGAVADFDVTTPGQHVLSYYAVDASGMAEAPNTLPLKLDWTEPILNLSSPTSTQYPQGSPVTVTADASDALSGLSTSQLDVDGTPVTSGQSLTGLAVGPHTCTLEGRDMAGNSATRQVSFVVIEPPSSTTGSPTAVTVRGDGRAIVNNRPVHVYVCARKTGAGKVSGALVYLDHRGRLQVMCRSISTVTRTDSGACLTADGYIRQGKGPTKRVKVSMEIFDGSEKRDCFTLKLDSGASFSGKLIRGNFVVR
jgi:hypothetical protein